MPKTVVRLFENPGVVEDVVREIEALGFPRNEVRTLDEPANFGTTGVMSFPRLEFEVDAIRELTRIRATKAEAQAYVEGLQRGGALVFATGSDEKVEAAADKMNRRGATPGLPHAAGENPSPMRDGSILAGRVRQPCGGVTFSLW